jgi:hypothetical protein
MLADCNSPDCKYPEFARPCNFATIESRSQPICFAGSCNFYLNQFLLLEKTVLYIALSILQYIHNFLFLIPLLWPVTHSQSSLTWPVSELKLDLVMIS